MKKRLGVLVTEKGIASSREKAKALIMAGQIFVDNVREDKAGSMFEETCDIVLHGEKPRYVSRGGLKLEKALSHFGVSPDSALGQDSTIPDMSPCLGILAFQRQEEFVIRKCVNNHGV